MPYLIVVNDDTGNSRWQIIDYVFPTPPSAPVRYIILGYHGYTPFTTIGSITIENAVTGAKGVGKLISI